MRAREDVYVPSVEELRQILGDGKSGALLVQSAERLAKALLARNLRMSQVRNVFDEIKKIENLWVWQGQEELALRRLRLLVPRIASRVKRAPGAELLLKVVDASANLIESSPQKKEAFLRFAEYMEAVVAYHDFYGRGESQE